MYVFTLILLNCFSHFCLGLTILFNFLRKYVSDFQMYLYVTFSQFWKYSFTWISWIFFLFCFCMCQCFSVHVNTFVFLLGIIYSDIGEVAKSHSCRKIKSQVRTETYFFQRWALNRLTLSDIKSKLLVEMFWRILLSSYSCRFCPHLKSVLSIYNEQWTIVVMF